MRFTAHERDLILKAVETEIKMIEDEKESSNKYMRLFKIHKNEKNMTKAVNIIIDMLYSDESET